MDGRERGSYAQGVYPIQDNSPMVTANVIQEGKRDTSYSKRVVRNLEERNVNTKRKSPKLTLTNLT